MNLNKTKQLIATVLGTVLPLEYTFKVSKNRYILAYHRVIPSALAQQFNMQDSMWISVDTFNDDIIWMKNHGDIVDLDTILDFDTPNSRPLFSITFDDGWMDNYDHAFPILKKYNIPATIFLVTDAIETGHLFWVEDLLYKVAQLSETQSTRTFRNILLSHRVKAGGKPPDSANMQQLAEGLAELIKPFPKKNRSAFLYDLYQDLGIDPNPISGQILNWSNVIEMGKHGIEFGSHTHTHEILKYIDNDIIADELATSKKIITDKTNKPVRYFCYPNARYRNDNADLINQAGYEYAFRIHNLRLNKDQSRYFVPRYLLNERTCHNKNYLLCKLLNLPKFY